MTDTMTRIASGLERAFAERGFAEPSVDDLRDAAGVSLRTLYKYAPSRDDMVLVALEHRHQRYVAQVFEDLPEPSRAALHAVMERIAAWMQREASHGCLFHAAVASAPRDDALRALLERHKREVADYAARAAELPGDETDLALVMEGLTQSWPLHGADAVVSAKKLCDGLLAARKRD